MDHPATGCRIVFNKCTILSSPCTVSEESIGSSQHMWQTLKNSQQDKVSRQKDVVAPQAQRQLTTKSAWVRTDSTLGHNIFTHYKDGCDIGTASLADVWYAARIESESSLNKTLSQGFTGKIRREFSSPIPQVNNTLLEGQHHISNWYLEGFF